MEIDFQDPKQLIALALVIIVIAAIALTVVFKPPAETNPTVTPSEIASAAPSKTPLPSVTASQQKYDYGKFMLDSKRETKTTAASGGTNVATSDSETLTNEGSNAAKFGVAEVFPLSSINDVEITAPSEDDPARLGATRHIDANPLTQLTDFELAPAQSVSFSARSTKTDLTENAPVRLLTQTELTALQRARLAPVLGKIADLILPLQQARALEAKANAAFARITQQQNAFEDYVDAVDEFAEDVHDETVAAQRAKPTPRPTPDVSKMNFPIPSPPAQPTREDVLALLPKFPEKIVLKVSEDNPSDEFFFAASPKAFMGTLAYKATGDAARYLRFSVESFDNTYLITVKADVRKAMKDKRIPFDSKTGRISFAFTLLPTEEKNTSVTIEVEHVEIEVEPPAEEPDSTVPSNILTGKKIFIDPGHGRVMSNGWDGGADCGKAVEAELTLALAKKAKALFEEAGATVELSRETNDKTFMLGPSARAKKANDFGADVLVSIHFNDGDAKTKCYDGKYTKILVEDYGWPACDERCGESAKLAKEINSKLEAVVGKSGGIGSQHDSQYTELSVLADAKMPAVLVETAFVGDPRVTEEWFQNSAAQAIFSGTRDYLLTKQVQPIAGTTQLVAWPANGKITSGFTATRDHGQHDSIDIGTDAGKEVYAPYDGEVTEVYNDLEASCGIGMRIQYAYPYQAYSSDYCHFSERIVKKGDSVKRCEQIAVMGATGKALDGTQYTTIHLHFELITKEHNIDPEAWLNRQNAAHCEKPAA